MKLTEDQINQLSKKNWRQGENIGSVTETVKLEGFEVKRRFIRLENDDGELLVIREQVNDLS